MKFVVLAIFAIFVAQSFHIGRKILVSFAIFAKFADISKPFLTFSLSKCRILWNLLFLLFLPYLLLKTFHIAGKILVFFAIFSKFPDIPKPFLTFSVFKCSISLNLLFLLFLLHLLLNLFTQQGKFPLLLGFLRNWRPSRSPSWPFLFVKVEFWKICYSCYFFHICYSIFSHTKKRSYFCDFCDICYFFYTFLIAVFFQSFLLKLRKQFASKFLLTRSILNISGRTVPQISLVTPSFLIELFIVLMQLNDTIHEGDGDRNVINWKYLLWVFKANNKLKECTS